jgi:hypothetical protein
MFFYSRNGPLELLNSIGPIVALLLAVDLSPTCHMRERLATQISSGIRQG